MKKTRETLKAAIVSILLVGTGISACAGRVGSGGQASWEEEVLLHDGSRLIAARSQTYGAYPTIDSRERAVLDEEWVFEIPATGQKVTWKSNHRRPPEGDSLMLILLGMANSTPYIATRPAGCIAYNHWGRPNPPYVFFRYNGRAWQRIPLAEFPAEFKDANVVVGGRMNPQKQAGTTLTIVQVNEQNRQLEPHLRQIVRDPIKGGGTNCAEMVYDGSGGWLGIDWFVSQPNEEACLKFCERKKIAPLYCPCERLFRGGK